MVAPAGENCVTQSLRSVSRDCIVRSFRSAECFLEQHDPDIPGCLLLDVVLPGMSGLELQHALIGSKIERPIIFVTAKGDVETCTHSMKAGAVDYLTIPIDQVRLFAAVAQALQIDCKRRCERAIRQVIERRVGMLTPRERQVMERVAVGRLNKQIATELGTGEKCVKVHRGRAMRKMGAGSVAELVRVAALIGISIDPAPRLLAAASNTDWVRMSNGGRRVEIAF